jgi:hypothetical protein
LHSHNTGSGSSRPPQSYDLRHDNAAAHIIDQHRQQAQAAAAAARPHHLNTDDPEALVEHLFSFGLTDAERTSSPAKGKRIASPESETSSTEARRQGDGRLDSLSSGESSAKRSSAPSSIGSAKVGGHKAAHHTRTDHVP